MAFRNADDYGDPLKNARFFRDLYRRQYSVEPAPKITVVYPSEAIYESKVHTAGGVSEEPYSSAEKAIEYLVFRTLMEKHFPSSGISDHITSYDPAVDLVAIENALDKLFAEKGLGSGLEDMGSNDNWVDSSADNAFTVSDIPDLVSDTLFESASDDMPEIDLIHEFATDSMLDDPPSEAESHAVEQMLDDLLDDTIDDMPLEDILEDIPDEMPENDMQEMDADMEPMEDPMEMNPYML